MRSAEVASDEETAEETQRLLNDEWRRLVGQVEQPNP